MPDDTLGTTSTSVRSPVPDPIAEDLLAVLVLDDAGPLGLARRQRGDAALRARDIGALAGDGSASGRGARRQARALPGGTCTASSSGRGPSGLGIASTTPVLAIQKWVATPT